MYNCAFDCYSVNKNFFLNPIKFGCVNKIGFVDLAFIETIKILSGGNSLRKVFCRGYTKFGSNQSIQIFNLPNQISVV